jgi:hypothetical protein
LPLLPVKNKILSNDIHLNFYAKMIDFHSLIKKNLQTTGSCLQTLTTRLNVSIWKEITIYLRINYEHLKEQKYNLNRFMTS